MRPTILDRYFSAGQQTEGQLAEWRQGQLERAGFDPELAASIATDPVMDLHALIELVERGCPPPLAARIMAPLEHRRKARDDHAQLQDDPRCSKEAAGLAGKAMIWEATKPRSKP
jgi:hypothetical protein